jgi:hypothetical protein
MHEYFVIDAYSAKDFSISQCFSFHIFYVATKNQIQYSFKMYQAVILLVLILRHAYLFQIKN